MHKRFLRLILMFVVTALAAVCCEEPSQPVDTSVSVSVRTAEVGKEAGSTFVSVKTEGLWTLDLVFEDGQKAWAELNVVSGRGENNGVILTYEANTKVIERSLTIEARGENGSFSECVVTQAPADHRQDPPETEEPEQPEEPENPEDPGQQEPEDPGQTEPEQPEPEDPGQPEDPENPENPEPEDPDTSTPAVDESWLELPSGMDGYLINTLYASGKRNYTHLYDPETYVSLWTAYPLNSSHMGSNSRPGSWTYNPLIDTDLQADLCSGSYSGDYSRGHMIPNGSRNGIREMQLQTFHVTNSVPQRQDRFNGTIWNYLENAVQAEAGSEEIYVITGVAFNKVGENKSISYTSPNKNSSQKCAVPNYFYKAVLKVNTSGSTVTSASTVGFWFEHKDYDKNDSYTNYSVSVDQLEEWLGYDLFVNLPDDVEAKAETNESWSSFTSF